MGVLRLILALSVVSGHGDFWRPFFFINASAAVVCFFVISGFYMAFVLNEKYESRVDFFTARLWRLYPAYLAFTALGALAWMAEGKHFSGLDALFSTTLIGQDYYWLAMRPDDPLDHIPIAQAWSVAVELQLYLLAALAFKTARGMVAVFLVGLLLRAVAHATGFLVNPLGVVLLPNVVVYFGAGAMAYLAYRKVRTLPLGARVGGAAFGFALLAAYVAHFDGFWKMDAPGADWRFYPLYAGVACVTPFLFSLTEKLRADRVIGDISYPIYLGHILVFDLARELGQGRWFVLAVTVGSAIAVNALVARLVLTLRSARSHPRVAQSFK